MRLWNKKIICGACHPTKVDRWGDQVEQGDRGNDPYSQGSHGLHPFPDGVGLLFTRRVGAGTFVSSERDLRPHSRGVMMRIFPVAAAIYASSIAAVLLTITVKHAVKTEPQAAVVEQVAPKADRQDIDTPKVVRVIPITSPIRPEIPIFVQQPAVEQPQEVPAPPRHVTPRGDVCKRHGGKRVDSGKSWHCEYPNRKELK